MGCVIQCDCILYQKPNIRKLPASNAMEKNRLPRQLVSDSWVYVCAGNQCWCGFCWYSEWFRRRSHLVCFPHLLEILAGGRWMTFGGKIQVMHGDLPLHAARD